MDKELIERLAEEAGFDTSPDPGTVLPEPDHFMRLAYVGEYPCGTEVAKLIALVAEECADECDRVIGDLGRRDEPWYVGAVYCVQAIRRKFKLEV